MPPFERIGEHKECNCIFSPLAQCHLKSSLFQLLCATAVEMIQLKKSEKLGTHEDYLSKLECFKKSDDAVSLKSRHINLKLDKISIEPRQEINDENLKPQAHPSFHQNNYLNRAFSREPDVYGKDIKCLVEFHTIKLDDDMRGYIRSFIGLYTDTLIENPFENEIFTLNN